MACSCQSHPAKQRQIRPLRVWSWLCKGRLLQSKFSPAMCFFLRVFSWNAEGEGRLLAVGSCWCCPAWTGAGRRPQHQGRCPHRGAAVAAVICSYHAWHLPRNFHAMVSLFPTGSILLHLHPNSVFLIHIVSAIFGIAGTGASVLLGLQNSTPQKTPVLPFECPWSLVVSALPPP